MNANSPLVGGGDPASTVFAARVLAHASIAVAAAILLVFLGVYVRRVLAEGFEYEWGFLAVGIAAAIVYGIAGLAADLTGSAWLAVFAEGAVLFFILFIALGIRAMYHADHPTGSSRLLPKWVDALVIVGFIAAWWVGYLAGGEWTRPVVAVGWIGASIWAVFYSVRTTQAHEGTTFSALTRHLLPAILCIVAVTMTDLATTVAAVDQSAVEAVWLVGTVLVAAFLFNTAVAIRQQEGEVERMYDRTTWRQQDIDE
ncbi:uncharacterized protein NP_0662A [Natronomonas pharaonis DSM 2160]|uniref:Uncharacterized protein n=1 Tax=Natronomonas pharaonis (strain ATCC 35678 / DSM 2160 / CIP 103997 / JCM 8858 / NBRC 14720 / NCIMB 2260 / Gabara) TaxID=348780 RepID=A0A1U7EU15_NATPD|nr:hypothetical protein [Natronomonas pharaonis]CAI48422.2 uncharacterized protein NP_0662A [Natronomonas pharaonis DSM 2160]